MGGGPVVADFSLGDADASAEMIRMENVQVTATRSERSIYDVSEAVSVLTAEEIERSAPDVLAEMLRGLPGTFFQQTTPGQGIPIIRGLKGSQVLHLVDGMRLNNAFFRNAPNQYLGLVDAYAVDRIEVVRGAASSLYGADAMGGVVQMLTPEPVFTDRDWQAHARVYSSYDSADNAFVFRTAAEAGMTGSTLSGGISYQDHSDRSIGGGDTIRPSGYESRAADAKWIQALGSRSELMLSAQLLEQPSTPRIDELVPGYGQDHPSSSKYFFEPNRRSFLHARYRLEGTSKWFEHLEVHLARQVIVDDRLTQEFGDPVRVNEENESVLDGLTLQFNTAPDSAGPKWTWGFEFYADEISSQRVRLDEYNGETEVVRGRFPDDSTMDSAAAYIASGWEWGRFSLNGGLRYSWFDIELPATTDVAGVNLSPSDLTGDIHMTWRLNPELHLVSNIGRGFRPPNIFDLGTLGPRPGNRFNVPNDSLKAEYVWSYDLGLKSAGDRWEAELFLFYSDYRDKISSVFTGEVTSEGRDVVRSDNLNTLEIYGVESGFRWYASPDFQLYGVLNYTRGEETENDGEVVPADRIPPLNGRLGLVYAPDNGLRIESWVDFAGRQDRLSPRDERDPRIDPSGTKAWSTINLLASYRTSERLELGLRLENLSDRRYREHGSGIDAAGLNVGFWINASY
jgi:outer membrane receptor protein involved in Fe transport